MSDSKALTPRQQRFVEEYLVDLNGTQAAVRAGYSPRTANEQGARLLAKASVKEMISAKQAERSERTRITADEVLQRWLTIATADPNELIDLRRICCRYCHGRDHRYQRTRAEMEALREQWRSMPVKEGQERPPLDEQGGEGYDERRGPHPDCPECFGLGVERVFPKDTRLASPQARLLYAGVKQTKEGLEIKLRDQDAAMTNVAKHLGMFKEHIDHTSGGKPLPPLSIAVAIVKPKGESAP